MAYVDANHTYEATMRYVHYLLPRMNEKGMYGFDDIHYSEEMERAWKELKNDDAGDNHHGSVPCRTAVRGSALSETTL